MDPVLVEYLNSGSAWVLVGSGPSIELGYPTWRDLATAAAGLATREGAHGAGARCLAALEAGDHQGTLQRAADAVGLDRLLEELRALLYPKASTSRLYDMLIRWPAAVYLTTNFDNEIQRRLGALGVPFEQYGNGPDHFSLLTSQFAGGVIKLHGDLTSTNGLILTASQYQDLLAGASYAYWRTRMTSVFQMQRVVVVGYSLSDPHIRAVLEAAKTGANATNPVCWIAPNVSTAEAAEYLERYRIRIVPYPETDDHSGMRRVLETVSQFVVPREGVRLRQAIADVMSEGSRGEPAATAVYVFNRLSPLVDIRRLRADVALATLESALPSIKVDDRFSVSDVLAAKGWPPDATDETLIREVERRAVRKGQAERTTGGLKRSADTSASDEHRRQFEHLRARFITSVALRIQRECTWTDGETSRRIAADIETALTGFFRRGGLTLASVLVSNRTRPVGRIPSSVIGFVSEASAQYERMEDRLAFWRGTLGAFTDAGDAERAYLGRLAQGFFAFHALGVFGDAAAEQLRNALRTVWLVDSSLQIPGLALASPSNNAYADVFKRLRGAGVRLFTTAKLFNETFVHLRFAVDIVNRFGADSHNTIAAAVGDPPYWKQNLFLQGFIQWTAAGNPGDWAAYLHAAVGSREPGPTHLETALRGLGIEVVDFQDWPGFAAAEFAQRDEYETRLKDLMRRHRVPEPGAEARFEGWLDEKIPPEAEAAVVVLRERSGQFGILSGPGVESPSWFVSATSIINALEQSANITWQPEAFLAFGGTLVAAEDGPSFDRAFEVVLSSIATSGLNPVPESAISAVFGSMIDEATLALAEQREALTQTLGSKYSERPEDVLRRIPPSRRLIATIQISRELVDRQTRDLAEARERGLEESKRAKRAEAELEGIGRLRRKAADRQALAKRRRRQSGAKRPKKPPP